MQLDPPEVMFCISKGSVPRGLRTCLFAVGVCDDPEDVGFTRVVLARDEIYSAQREEYGLVL